MYRLHLLYFFGVILVSLVYCDVKARNVSVALNQFSLKLLRESSRRSSENENLIIGPYTIWTALSILNEGAGGTTAQQLENVLGIPSNDSDRQKFKHLQHNFIKNLKKNLDGITLDNANDIYVKKDAIISKTYQHIVQNTYNVTIESVDFGNPYYAAKKINDKVSYVTRGKINNIVDEGSMAGAYMYIASAMYFKGLWKKAFEKPAFKRPFFNDNGDKLNEVLMMYAGDKYVSSNILHNTADVLEIPYKGDSVSMVIVLPKKGSFSSVLQNITEKPFKQILRRLRNQTETDVDVIMPKFKISTNVQLKDTLETMGIKDVFTPSANLTQISSTDLHVSSVVHRAEIEVDEDGTVAAASSLIGAIPITISSTPEFNVNRPFLFFIFDKQTNVILFMGKVMNPALISIM